MPTTIRLERGSRIGCDILLIPQQKHSVVRFELAHSGCQYLSEFVGVSQLKIGCVV